ncbi:MAG: AtpZ/AtpI family protein [Planctomycetes bacterium]|nr:AtpZ/AtpI family protein [Planctomycetota bacterium]
MPPSPTDRGARHLGAGLTLVVTVGLFTFGGHWLDARLHTSPLFLLVGLAAGFAGGLLHLLRVLAPELLPFGKNKAGTGARKEPPEPPPPGPVAKS